MSHEFSHAVGLFRGAGQRLLTALRSLIRIAQIPQGPRQMGETQCLGVNSVHKTSIVVFVGLEESQALPLMSPALGKLPAQNQAAAHVGMCLYEEDGVPRVFRNFQELVA